MSTVDGVQVIADEAVESPLSKPDQKIYFTRIRRLLLADETTVYSCTECDFTDAEMPMVRGHVGSKHPKPRRANSAAAPQAQSLPMDMTLGELLERARHSEALMATIERQADELAALRTRARKAEREIATIRKALRG
jgi:hypothetical protein